MFDCKEHDDVVSLFNSQAHIDEIDTGLTCNEKYRSHKYTFMLKHKHFDLSPGEVLFVEKIKNGYNVTVKSYNSLERDVKPVMWLYASAWRPFAYTKGEDGCCEVPDMPAGNHNLGARWLNNGGTEFTDEFHRTQYVRPELGSGEAIITLVNCECNSGCATKCEKTMCTATNGGHRWAHTRPHQGKPK